MRFIIIITALSFIGCNSWKHGKNFNYSDLTFSDFNKALKSDSNYIILDVRTPKEYRHGHMKNAVNVSYFGSVFTDSIKKLDRNKTVYMYCQTQHRSPLASKKMKKLGFRKIIDLKGGFMKWENNQMPIEK
ncbi:MAG: rhodanese-like domain-containing protein [Bacteroidia bacterium]|nr:rhodanese-like domain-containing protein [Bacteroidia bacterium]